MVMNGTEEGGGLENTMAMKSECEPDLLAGLGACEISSQW